QHAPGTVKISCTRFRVRVVLSTVVFVSSMTGGRVFFLCLTACLGCAWAQTEESIEAKRPESREETHMLGIVPDYDTVRNASGVIMPISARRKFWLATEDVFDPFSFLI